MNCALLGEGGSDRCLLPVLRWLLQRNTPTEVIVNWVDTTRFPPARSLAEKVHQASLAQPCDLLFVHRDADERDPEPRYREIQGAVTSTCFVAVVPVRMTEAWLLFDEPAIRAAAGRVSGREPLNLPPLGRVEALADPKRALKEALLIANGRTGRHRDRFDVGRAVHRLADLIDDWSPLRQLSAFRRLEGDIQDALASMDITLA